MNWIRFPYSSHRVWHSRNTACAVIAACSALVSAATAQVIVRVDDDAPPGGDGSTWTMAYNDLHAALASGADEIWVAQGSYKPAGPGGDRNATFTVPGGVELYGGFFGDEQSHDERDPAAYPTILSGDLNGDDGAGSWVNYGDNSHHVVTVANTAALTTIDGFVIRAGQAWSSSGPNSAGAGLFIDTSLVRVAHCTVEDNLAHLGAGMYAFRSEVTVDGCTFEGNYASDGRGGAIYFAADGQMPGVVYRSTLVDSAFTRNLAHSGGGPGDAGAVWSSFDAPIDVRGCVFEHNEAGWRFATGQFATGGGAMLVFGAGSTIDRCTFRNNRAHIGGALWIGRDTTVTNSLFVANEAYRQSAGFNDYGGYAGAVYCAGGHTDLVSSTLHANNARSVGGVMQGLVGTATIANSLLWSNTSTEEEATTLDRQIGGDLTLLHSCLRGLFEQIPGEDPPNPADFPGCIDTDPMFVDEIGADGVAGTIDDDLHLQPGSPAIDAGDDTLIPAWAMTDLDGNSRLVDDPDSPNGANALSDMGALEYQPASTLPGDLAEPFGVIDVFDLFVLLANWGTSGAGADIAPPIDTVDVFDLFEVLGHWGG